MTTDTDVNQEIAGIIKGIFAAFEDHEPGGIEAHMHPDATVWDVFTPHLIRGTEEREKFHADDQKQNAGARSPYPVYRRTRGRHLGGYDHRLLLPELQI